MATPRKPSPRRSGSRPQTPGRRAPSDRAAARPAPRSDKSSGKTAGAAAPKRRPAAKPAKEPRPLGPAPVLTTKQRCHLRGLGHHLEPVVQIGKEGITEALCSAVSAALLRHELIKLRIAETVEGERHELATELSARSHAALVQVLGRTVLLYRRRPSEPRGRDALPHVPLG